MPQFRAHKCEMDYVVWSSFLTLKYCIHQVVLEPRCCDGSDELPGVCENVCKAVGEKYRKEHEVEMKLRKTVSCVAIKTLGCSLSISIRH